ncbi:hypothetical protein EG68_03384 [Paragonimus skrjabini miyazakii]|uniref:Uncharacterized protein n=1 Tax=Paragonimus skrjabini miyazakii TaxID=59628 RepID=A0A8S9Z0Z5_9TREM|nr:hypothetical protein EG68_03384 [Paragonimus skrjabini miyazakii]
MKLQPSYLRIMDDYDSDESWCMVSPATVFTDGCQYAVSILTRTEGDHYNLCPMV